MAHHKRRSRRRDKRSFYDCGCCIRTNKIPPETEEDQICMGKAKKSKASPKKEKCPAGKSHEWYREEHIKKVPRYRWDAEYNWIPRDIEEHRYEIKTCINCWTVKEKRLYEKTAWHTFYNYHLPKREVKF